MGVADAVYKNQSSYFVARPKLICFVVQKPGNHRDKLGGVLLPTLTTMFTAEASPSRFLENFLSPSLMRGPEPPDLCRTLAMDHVMNP